MHQSNDIVLIAASFYFLKIRQIVFRILSKIYDMYVTVTFTYYKVIQNVIPSNRRKNDEKPANRFESIIKINGPWNIGHSDHLLWGHLPCDIKQSSQESWKCIKEYWRYWAKSLDYEMYVTVTYACYNVIHHVIPVSLPRMMKIHQIVFTMLSKITGLWNVGHINLHILCHMPCHTKKSSQEWWKSINQIIFDILSKSVKLCSRYWAKLPDTEI